MIPVLVLLLVLVVFGGLGFAMEVFWFVLLAALVLWVLGFFFGGGAAAGSGRRGWYRW